MLLADASSPFQDAAYDTSTDMLRSASKQTDERDAHDGSGDDSHDAASGSGSDESDGNVASLRLPMPRRSLQLQFTCGKCGAAFCDRPATLLTPVKQRQGQNIQKVPHLSCCIQRCLLPFTIYSAIVCF